MTTAMNVSTQPTYEMIPVSQLKIEMYQRILNTAFSKQIGKSFDMNKAGVVTVSFRDGEYNVVDGQHRTYAAKIAKVPMLMCQVLHGLTYEEEALLFKELNKDRKGLLAFDYFKADVEAKNEQAIDIKRIIESNNISIARGPGISKIQALAAVRNIYDKYGSKKLDFTLALTMSTWDGVSESLGSIFLKGMSEFVDVYHTDIKIKTFERQLKRIEPARIIREAEGDTSNVSKVVKMVNILFRYYNARLTSNKLPNKHFIKSI